MLAAGLAMIADSALALQAQNTFAAKATVVKSCVISDGRLSFGQYSTVDNARVPLDAESVGVTVTCVSDTAYKVYSTTATKALVKSGGGATLAFQLYSNAGRTVVLPTSNTSGAIAGTGNGYAQAITIYGRIPAGQKPQAGNYSLMTNLTVYF